MLKKRASTKEEKRRMGDEKQGVEVGVKIHRLTYEKSPTYRLIVLCYVVNYCIYLNIQWPWMYDHSQ